MSTASPTARRLLAALLVLPLVLAYGCGRVDVSTDGSVLLHPNGDVLAVGNPVQLHDSVSGDAMTAGGTVTFDGFTGGSYLGAGGSQEIRGTIGGSVRAAGGQVVVAATVGRNVTAAGGNVELRDDARIEHNAYLAGGRIHLSGEVGGDVYAGGSEVVIDGAIGGDVRVEAERLTLGPDARLGGELRYRVADGQATLDPLAVVGGDVEALPPRDEDEGGVLWFALRMLGFVLAGTVVVALLPGLTDRLADTVGDRPAIALGLGFAWILLVPIAAVATAATVVGVPLAAVGIGLYAISLYLAPIVPAVWVGAELVPGPSQPTARNRVLEFLAGGLIVSFAILLPWVGWLVRFFAVALGLGAIALALATAWSSRGSGAGAAEAP